MVWKFSVPHPPSVCLKELCEEGRSPVLPGLKGSRVTVLVLSAPLWSLGLNMSASPQRQVAVNVLRNRSKVLLGTGLRKEGGKANLCWEAYVREESKSSL